MDLPKFDQLSLEAVMEEDKLIAADAETVAGSEVTDDDYIDEEISSEGTPIDEDGHVYKTAIAAVEKYLEDNSEFYPKLQQLRVKGCKKPTSDKQKPKGDQHSTKQPQDAKKDSEKWERQLSKKMREIAKAMQKESKAFTIASETEAPRILDLCTSHGPLLAFALEKNPTAHAVTFKLPLDEGGLTPTVEESETVEIHMCDINTLAADMGLSPREIPQTHPYAKRYDPTRYFEDGLGFDLVICDGPFYQTQKLYRKNHQSRGLLLAQLALGLEHLRDGGTMIVMLQKLEWIQTIRLWLDFKGFADIDFFKPRYLDAPKPYFYMVAYNIKATSEEASEAVKEWKREWKVATLGTNKQWRKEKDSLAGFCGLGVDGVLGQYGPELMQWGDYIWKREFDGLKKVLKAKT